MEILQKICNNKSIFANNETKKFHSFVNFSDSTLCAEGLNPPTIESFYTKWCKIFDAWTLPISEFDENFLGCYNI